jgi:hypothetical protein
MWVLLPLLLLGCVIPVNLFLLLQQLLSILIKLTHKVCKYLSSLPIHHPQLL